MFDNNQEHPNAIDCFTFTNSQTSFPFKLLGITWLASTTWR